MLQRPYHRLTPPALLLLCCGLPCLAQEAPDFKLNASYAVLTDNNLFRLPDNTNTAALLGNSGGSEVIQVASVGINYKNLYSLQRFELGLNLINYQYQNFDYLSYTARNFDAAWRWSFTPRLHGNLSTERKETLNSFADYQGYNSRNQRTDTRTLFDAVYELTGPWRVIAGTAHTRQINDQAFLASGDYSTSTANLGLRYVFSSGSALTYTATTANGQYLNRVLSAAGFYDDAFTQIDNELRLHWVITGNSTLDLRAAQISRSHPHYAQRDYSGLNTGANLSWQLSGKSALNLSMAREYSAYQTNDYNYSQIDRFTVAPVWQAGAKVLLRLRYELAQRNFLGSPTGNIGPQRDDTTRETSLSMEWQPYKFFSVITALQSASRSSSLPGLDYHSNMASITAQFSF